MKYFLTFCCAFFFLASAQAQFQVGKAGLMIMVSDGTNSGKHSQIVAPESIPSSYGDTESKMTSKGVASAFSDPIRSLGMTDCIQAAAFLERPEFGKVGFLLIFSINDSIGGQQASLTMPDGNTYQGVYRLVRQKTSAEEPVPAGMTTYKVEGTFFMLGIS